MDNINSRFLSELSDVFSSDKKIEACDREMQNYIEIQKKRLDKKGLVLDYDFLDRGQNPNGTEQGWEARDEHYFAKMWNSSKIYKRVLIKNGKKISKKKKNVSVWAMVMNYINGQNMDDEIYVCPNCGNPEKIKALTAGCPYCNTSFKMDELYPKVTSYNLVYDPSKNPKEMIRYYLIVMAIVMAVMLVAIPLLIVLGVALISLILAALNLITWEAIGQGITIALGLFVQLLCAAPFVGLIAAGLILLVKLLIEGAKNAPLLKTFSTHKMFEDELKKYGQDYLPELFMSRTVGKMKAAIYSDDANELPYYEGKPLPEEMKDIVDIFFRGAIEFKKVDVINDVAHVNVDIYTEVLKENNGKATETPRVFNINMRKNISKKSSINFSISKFMCPTCGSSFNAYMHKTCPSCGNKYNVEDEDWVIESIR